jgi:uncharacterized protein (TIGR03118 family)
MNPIAAVEGTAFNGAAATFTSTDPASATVTATINWGDGTTTTGTVAPDPAGGFDVNGTHTYTEEGTYQVRVALSDTAGSRTRTSGPANVLDAPLSIAAQTFAATEGTPFTGTVATFTDGDPNATPGEFRATIDWGDGTRSKGHVSSASGGGFQVTGTHTYTDEGKFTPIVTVRDGENNIATTGFGNQSNLVSNIPGLAKSTDADLVNPWGVSFSATSPFWVSDNGTGLSTLYNGAGVKQGLIVTIPTPKGGTPPSTPTGQVNNGNATEFLVDPATANSGARFIFATEDGTISAWNGGAAAVLKVDNSMTTYPNGGVGAVYKGLALASKGGTNNDFLYAANFRSGNVDVFDNKFGSAGSFTDPSLKAIGYAPFGIATINGNLYVTFAKQDADRADDVAGAGHGFIDVFSPSGTMLDRLVSRGQLDSPWGLAVAPTGFGKFGGDLLVGNFGNGQINAYDLASGAFKGTLKADGSHKPIAIDGLWAISFGNNQATVPPNTLYFTAGPNDEADGLFGTISPSLAPTVTVAEGDQLTGVPTTVTSFHGTTVHGTVALFQDTDKVTPASDFTATIDWGDGSTSTGMVRGGHGLFRVVGSHTYATTGTYQVKVTLTDDPPGTAQAVAQSTALATGVDVSDGNGNGNGHDHDHHHRYHHHRRGND